MELMFNELSVKPYSSNKYSAYDRMSAFALTMKEARENGFRKIRAHHNASEILLTEEYSLHSWLIDKGASRDDKDFLFGTLVRPFINEEDEEMEEEYISSNYHYLQGADTQLECLGLTAAYLYDLPSISFNSSEEWQLNQLNIYVETEGVTSLHQVYNVFSSNCFSVPDIAQHIENLGDVELLISYLTPDEKDIHITGHHGQKELKSLWKKLKFSEFVISGLTIEWGGQSFIRATTTDGIIEIVLHKTARQYAMRVTTTGRNKRETEEIAKLLKDKFDK